MNRLRSVLAVSAAGFAVLAGGCSVSSPTSTAGATTGTAQPDTKAAARSAAQEFMSLYSAGLWDAAWQYLTPADKQQVPESLYTAFHNGCPSESAGMAYSISDVTLAGQAAVITYTIPVLAKAFGSATMTMDWAPTGWGVSLDAAALKDYTHGSATADIAAAKAAGECSGS